MGATPHKGETKADGLNGECARSQVQASHHRVSTAPHKEGQRPGGECASRAPHQRHSTREGPNKGRRVASRAPHQRHSTREGQRPDRAVGHPRALGPLDIAQARGTGSQHWREALAQKSRVRAGLKALHCSTAQGWEQRATPHKGGTKANGPNGECARPQVQASHHRVSAAPHKEGQRPGGECASRAPHQRHSTREGPNKAGGSRAELLIRDTPHGRGQRPEGREPSSSSETLHTGGARGRRGARAELLNRDTPHGMGHSKWR